MHVTAMQGARLGKYLTMPYRKNATARTILLLALVDKHGIILVFINAVYSKTVKSFFCIL